MNKKFIFFKKKEQFKIKKKYKKFEIENKKKFWKIKINTNIKQEKSNK